MCVFYCTLSGEIIHLSCTQASSIMCNQCVCSSLVAHRSLGGAALSLPGGLVPVWRTCSSHSPWDQAGRHLPRARREGRRAKVGGEEGVGGVGMGGCEGEGVRGSENKRKWGSGGQSFVFITESLVHFQLHKQPSNSWYWFGQVSYKASICYTTPVAPRYYCLGMLIRLHLIMRCISHSHCNLRATGEEAYENDEVHS